MLPGTPSDYHFAIIGASGALWSKRTSDPRVFGWVERLCLADIAMIESLGDVAEPITTERTAYDGTRFPAFPSYDQLSSMYVREGFLADAADIERRFGAVSGGERPAGQSVIARHQALLEEDGR